MCSIFMDDQDDLRLYGHNSHPLFLPSRLLQDQVRAPQWQVVEHFAAHYIATNLMVDLVAATVLLHGLILFQRSQYADSDYLPLQLEVCKIFWQKVPTMEPLMLHDFAAILIVNDEVVLQQPLKHENKTITVNLAGFTSQKASSVRVKLKFRKRQEN